MNRVLLLFAAVIGILMTTSSVVAIDKATLRWMRDKPVIDSIAISGNEFFSDGEIRDRMYSRERNLWYSVKGDRRSRLQRETLGKDTLEVKYMYYIDGFLGVQVEESFEAIIEGEDTAALVRIDIHEGQRFYYGAKSLTGNYEPGFDTRLRETFKELKVNEPVNPFELRTVVFEMKSILADRGYPYASVSYRLDTVSTPPLTPVTFEVQDDSLVRFGEIAVEGVNWYPEYVARRELKLKPGEMYRRKDIIDSRRRLYESGYFSFVQLETAPVIRQRERPDFVLRVRERKPRYISFTTGAGQSEVRDLQWDFSGGFGKRNFWGSRRIDLLAEYSFSIGRDSRLINHAYQIKFTEPWMLGIRMPIQLTVQYEPPIKSPLQDYTISAASFAASTNKRFGDEIRTTTGMEYARVDISGIPPEKADSLKEEQGISVRRKIYGSIRIDSRDNVFVPREGQYTELIVEYYGGFLGGDDDFYKLGASWSTYQTVWPGWIGAVRIKAGYAHAFWGSDEVPTDELLYLGGANTIRGFVENTLGPLREDGSAEGSHFTLIGNLEFRWKTVQVLNAVPAIGKLFRQFPLWQSIFFDMGNGFRERRNVRFDRLAYSFGTGIQIMSPAGPIRVDYARRIRTERYESGDRWHFTILYAF